MTRGISSGRRSISVAAALNTESQWPQRTRPLCALSCDAVTWKIASHEVHCA
ncbi:MAG: hypothetical protein OXU31_04690 [Gammaproteobacteria bacterium]|nr:hypothetical protein [Gammaproteobacteria bacterium]MDD9851064.1 hypothetical protein [Gammaproteobacteria bacterium]